jgi:thiamine-phosphate diphosphorylase
MLRARHAERVQELRRALRVYVVTSAHLIPGRGHAEVAMAAIEGGAGAVQLRAPELRDRPDRLLALAAGLAGPCRERGVLFIVNNSIEVALESGADGVHLGQGDDPGRARERLGAGRVLGVSVESPQQARAAERMGADYLAVTVWATPTKPEAMAGGLAGLRAVVAATVLPVIGIGGIDASNAAQVLAAGAAGVAVVSAVGSAADPVAATRELSAVVSAASSGAGFE